MGLVDLCDEYGVKFLATSGGTLSAKSAPQWLSVKQQAVFSEYFAREQSDKIQRAQDSCRERGVFGFTSKHLAWHLMKDPTDPHKIIPHPDRWEDARQAALDYGMARRNSREICRWICAKHGVMKQSSSLNKWLKNQWLLGHYAKRDTGEVMIANVAPALVTEAEWNLIQDRLKANSKGKGARAPHKVRPLSGIARCKHCGGRLTTKTVKSVYEYLRCQNLGCPASSSGIRSDKVELEVKSSCGLKTDLVADLIRRQQVKSKPSKELLNLRKSAQGLQDSLAVDDDPVVRAAYEAKLLKIARLEEESAPV